MEPQVEINYEYQIKLINYKNYFSKEIFLYEIYSELFINRNKISKTLTERINEGHKNRPLPPRPSPPECETRQDKATEKPLYHSTIILDHCISTATGVATLTTALQEQVDVKP